MWDGNVVVGRFKEAEERQNLMMLYYNLSSKFKKSKKQSGTTSLKVAFSADVQTNPKL